MRRSGWIGSRRDWTQDFAVSGVVGVFLGAVGPFGSYINGPPWQRIAYWTAAVWVGLVAYGIAVRFVMSRRLSPPLTVAALAVAVVAIAFPFAVGIDLAAPAVWPALSGFSYSTWYAQVLVVSSPMVAGFALLERARERRRAASDARQLPVDEGLLAAAPAEVLCLQMEDHYVRVHTARGSRLVLATLAQAIAALKGAPGLQVHRSWWVAEKAVSGAVADGRNIRLQLVNGLTAPVARSSVAAVRAAGWLERNRA
jgi:DNA-binding LytR/AlgR family response regulator